MVDMGLLLAIAASSAKPPVAKIRFELNPDDGCMYVTYPDTWGIFSINQEDGCMYVDYPYDVPDGE